jgi:hypothetical protein
MMYYFPPKSARRRRGLADGEVFACHIVREVVHGRSLRFAIPAGSDSRAVGLEFGRGWKLAPRPQPPAGWTVDDDGTIREVPVRGSR